MSDGIRVAAHICAEYGEYSDQRTAWLEAEALGVDAVFNSDHFFPPEDQPNGKYLECWTLLAAMAEVTHQIEIGSLVTCVSYRNSHLLADMARTVDNISGGRLVLGLGAGWFQRDYQEYGYEFGTAESRGVALGDGVATIKQRLGQLSPPPLRHIPLVIGGGSARMLDLAARHADIWHCSGSPAMIRARTEALDKICHRIGRDPSTIERSCGLWNFRHHRWETDRLEEFISLGVTLVTIPVPGPKYDLGPVRDVIAMRNERHGRRMADA